MDKTARFYSQGPEIVSSGVSFRTWAPQKRSVSLVVFAGPGSIQHELELRKEENGYWEVIDPEAASGTLYQYRLDGHLFPDPASRFQPFGAHQPSQVVKSRFSWSDAQWQHPSMRELVIYELHVGAFTEEGTFSGLAKRLDYFCDLGVNAIELMPIADFPGRWNWGYDGVYLFAPARAYGQPDDLRRLIDLAHNAGLTVILDLVYNHLGPDGNYLGSYSDFYFNEKHHTPWGNAFNLDNENAGPVRRLFVENAWYWRTEFHIDAFRLDATQAIPDDSPEHLIQEITEQMQAQGGLVICEDPRNERKLLLSRSEGGYGCDAVWADDFHHVVRVQMTGEHEGYLGYFKGTIVELVRTLQEGWLFTGQIQKDGLPRGTTGEDLAPERFVHCISNHDQTGNRAFGDRLNQIVSLAAYRAASSLLLFDPYTPMLFMGQEWAASTPFLYFTDHEPVLGRNISRGRREEFSDFSEFRDPIKREKIPDPQAESTFQASHLQWAELAEPKHRSVWQLYRFLIRFRREHLPERGRGTWTVGQVGPKAIALHYRAQKPEVLLIVQLVPGEQLLDTNSSSLRPTNGGDWKLAFSSNDAAYGGERAALFDPNKKQLLLNAPEVVAFIQA
jgi:maltooligosyltrehalose trehalohydrolase